MFWIDQKYLQLISYKLDKFKRRGNVHNLRCPYCNDSQRNKNKARGYIYEVKDSLRYHCHNCGISKKFRYFLKDIDQYSYNSYMKDLLTQTSQVSAVPVETKPKLDKIEIDLETVESLPFAHIARQYLFGRKIPKEFYKKLYYAPKYMEWINTKIPGKFSEAALKHDGPRIVVPYVTSDNVITAVTGRALYDDAIRYNMIVFSEDCPHVFGLDRINFNKKFYTVEGPFDSMFLDNCVAVGGAELVSHIRRLGVDLSRSVFIFDNQPRNKDIVGRTQACVDAGYSTLIWPELDTLGDGKDINDLVKSGLNKSEVQAIIDQHTYRGLTAKVKFNEWKKL